MFARLPIALAALAVAVAPACEDHHDDDDCGCDPYVYEVEPNDFYWMANGLGPIEVGESRLVRGSIADDGSDPFDGFALLAQTPMDVEFRLYSDDPMDDLDLALFDPYTGQTVATWETGAQPEAGVFSIFSCCTEFHLVVNSYAGSGAYTLEIYAQPLNWADGPAPVGILANGARRDEAGRDWSGYAERAAAPAADRRQAWVEVQTFAIDERTGRVQGAPQRRWIPVAATD